MQLGCLADDVTGATDVAAALRRSGLRVALIFGVPDPETAVPDAQAVVVALKSRTIPPLEAVTQSVATVRWLRSHGAPRIYFKYCSTFDSTPQGNIGPVADALLDQLGASQTLICPASPVHGRTTYQGHLFVGDRLLSESSMRHHPLTPMTDPDLVRVLGRQTGRPVGLLPHAVVRAGVAATAAHLEQLRADGVTHVVVDALEESDLDVVARAGSDLVLVTGGAGLAGAVGREHGAAGRAEERVVLPDGPAVVLAGSCSETTQAQVRLARAKLPAYRLDPVRTPDPAVMTEEALRWVRQRWRDGPLLVYSTAGPQERAAASAAMGPDTAKHLEATLGRVAAQARDLGACRIVVAGGETSGAVVRALGNPAVTVAGEADPGVPWCLTGAETPMALLLKSGNFGREDLLLRAVEVPA